MSLIMQYVTGIVFVLMVLASILLMKDVRETGMEPPLEVTEIEIVEAETEPVLKYSKDGLLIVPYEPYPTFIEAFAYAKETLGDSTSSGSKQWYLWRGGMYHTENVKSQ